ncbi:MAG: pyridoxine 5'-phosphate synthase [Candidatus Aminicenantes bacterium]|nr:pyridoxine 5'-phosphate synthase [Candidatus Aminicenantes bacterium]
MRLAVNIDHFATLREARKSNVPEPVLAALLAEQAGASGIVCHIRGDRRHIKERDLQVLRKTIKTKLNIEMAATQEMKQIAIEIMPDTVSLVPEQEHELTTQGGLDVIKNKIQLSAHIKALQRRGMKVSIFVDPSEKQIKTCKELNVDLIEINTGKYAELKPGDERDHAEGEIKKAAQNAHEIGLEVHAGHGLDYWNICPIAAIEEITEFSIGFSIVARSSIVGVNKAVKDMIQLLE